MHCKLRDEKVILLLIEVEDRPLRCIDLPCFVQAFEGDAGDAKENGQR